MTIYKYPLQIRPDFNVGMPRHAKVVKAAMQNGAPYLWAEVDPKEETINHRYGIFGTGHFIPETWSHVYTFFDGEFVWHLYKFTPF